MGLRADRTLRLLPRLACGCVLFFGLAAHLFAADKLGRRVADVLTDLRAQGLVFIYNTQLVGDELRVKAEPQAQSGVALAREVLAEHGLSLLPIAQNVFAVVMRTPRDDREAAPGRPAVTLAEVVVHTSRYSLASETAGSHNVLTQEQVENLPRLGDETLRAVQRLPGAAVNGFSSLAAIRGGAPDETGIVLDGMRLYEPFHLKNFLSPVSLLDARLIGSMDVYSGGFSAQYGDRMSAIIDAKTVRPDAPRYYELGLSVFHLSGLASAEFADGKAGALVSARRSNLSEIASLSEHDYGEPSYSDGFARLTYEFNERTRGSLNFLLSRDKIDALKDQGRQRARAEYRNNYVWAALTHEWSASSATDVVAGFTDVTNERTGQVDDPGRRTGAVTDLRSFHIASIRIDHRLAGALGDFPLEQRFGIEARQLSADYRYESFVQFEPDFPFPGSPPAQTQRLVTPAPEGEEYAAYWEGRIELGSRVAIQAGVRMDNQSEYGTQYSAAEHATQWSPRVSVLYAPTPATKLRASWGRFFQAQGINELQVEDGVDRFYPADRADHLIVGVEQSLGDGYALRVEAYRKQYDRLQPRYENLFDPLSLLPEVEFDRVAIAPLSARSEGIEALLTAQTGGAWSGWLGYTYSRAEDRVLEGANTRDVPRTWDQTHAINIGVGWSRGSWAVTLANLYHTGWTTTEVTLAPQPAIGSRNAKRLNAYNSLDLRVTRTFKLSRGELDAFIELTNTISRDNPCCTQYSVEQDANGVTFLTRDTNYWLPLTPSAGVLWRY